MKHIVRTIRDSGVRPRPSLYTLCGDRKGFTLVEVMVSITIFAGVVTLMLSLFTYTLRLYRRVEAQRQVAQSVRTTMEFLTKEIRNGQVDYGIVGGVVRDNPVDTHCPIPATLSDDTYHLADTYLGLINIEGDRECLYWEHDPDPAKQDDPGNNNLFLKKQTVATAAQLNPPNVKIKDLRFYVRPLHDPYTATPNLAEYQPLVTIIAQVSVSLSSGEVRTISYQTSVSTYAYDIPTE